MERVRGGLDARKNPRLLATRGHDRIVPHRLFRGPPPALWRPDGRVGAALTARNGKISGVAFSQAVSGYGVEGQMWNQLVDQLDWQASAEIARTYVQGMLLTMPCT